jgi:hypothetical protein
MKKPKPSRTGLKFIAAAIVWNVLAVVGSLTLAARGDGSTLAALERMPVHTTDRNEPEEDRKKRLREIADGIDGATADRLKRAMLVVLGRYESHFARDVCSGEGLGDKGKAYGCFQGWVPENERGGVESQALWSLDRLEMAGNYCAARGYDWVVGAFSLYGTGRTCSAPWAHMRAQQAKTLAGRL